MAKKKIDFNLLKQLFCITLKLSSFTFGGGYAIVPLLQDEITQKRDWIDEKDILDIVALSQSLPGAIAVNSCIFIGYKLAGILGAAVTVLGTVLPPLIIISLLTSIYQVMIANHFIAAILLGLRAGVVAIIADAVYKMAKGAIREPFSATLSISVLIAITFFDVNAILLIFLSGSAGFIHFLWQKHHSKNKRIEAGQ
ncbi:MAG: chromate transporter [Clostridiales bacterium]